MYISWLFLYTSTTWEGHICLHIYIFTYFLSACFLQIVGEVIWHGRWASFPCGEEFHWYGPKIIFCSMYTSVSPKKNFFNIMNFVGIASHITCTFLSDYSINFHVYMLISVYILIFLYIFCLQILGIDCGCRDITWQINPLIFDWRLQWHFSQVDTTLKIWHSMQLTFMSDVWVLLHFWEYFTKFGCTISYSSYIYHCFIKMWYMSLK